MAFSSLAGRASRRRRFSIMLMATSVCGTLAAAPAFARATPPEPYESVEPRFDPPCGQPDSVPVAFDRSNVAGTSGETSATAAAYHRIVTRFHVVRRSDGTGGIDENVIPFLVRDLNHGFRDTPFRFVRQPGVSYINNSGYYTNINFNPTGQSILTQIATPGVLNIVLAPVLQGGATNALGPPSPRGIFIDYTAAGSPASMAVPAHEAGHVFSLLHPFETGLGVECTSGVNCVTAGDRICDTPASTGVHGGNTLATGVYFLSANGPCPGDPPYAPQTRTYMEANWAYDDTLKDRFTANQLAAMLASVTGLQSDLIGGARPSVVVDCDTDGVDDITAILDAAVMDDNRDGVPDACQLFAQPGDLIVSCMTNAATNRPRVFSRTSGAHRVDLWNGIPFAHSLRLGPGGLVHMPTLTVIERISLSSGRTVDNFVDGSLQGAATSVDVLFTEAGDLLVLDNATNNIRRYSGATGTYLGEFATLVPIGMTALKAMEYGPDGHIYVVGNGALGNTVQRIHGSTGARLGAWVSAGSGGLGSGQGLVFHNGLLLVADGVNNAIRRYDAASGAYVDTLVLPGAGGLSNPHAPRIGPDNHLYVVSRTANSVKRYHGQTGAYLGDFVSPGAGGSVGTGGLTQPTGLLFAPCPCPGDINGDGKVDGLDIADLAGCLVAPTNACMCADIDGVAGVTAADVAPLVARLLSGAPCE